MTFSLLHPSIRPEKWREIYDAWLKAAAHPEDVEYILCVDPKWGFPLNDEGLEDWEEERGNELDEANLVFWNSDGYVAAVNQAARAATGDVLIVIADDIWPAERWDEVLEQSLFGPSLHSDFIVGGNDAAEAKRQAAMKEQMATGKYFITSEFAIWVNNGGSADRRAAVHDTIAEMPVVSRSRVERLGYLYYPGYLSMYADNDLVEHWKMDAEAGRCSLIRLEEPVFPHLHPVSDPSIPVDAAYQWQNRPAAYALGLKLLEARRAAKFTDVVLPEKTKRPRIAVCIAGNSFSLPWVIQWTKLLYLGATVHDWDLHWASGVTNVYHMRIGMARQVIADGRADYVLWIDDDQLVQPEHVLQLVKDLEERPDIDMVAGWTITGEDSYSTAPQLSCGWSMDALGLPDALMAYPEDLVPVLYTGFPLVLMRYELLNELGQESFWPYEDQIPEINFPTGEDVSFCLNARDINRKVFVDRRVGPLPHLKLRDIAGGVMR